MPKVYGFDTGFVCHARGWRALRHEDLGFLWEHLVLDELHAEFGPEAIFYWRDKQKREIDFVLARRGRDPVAIECKWKLKSAHRTQFSAFQALYPTARQILVTSDGSEPFVNRKQNRIETGLLHLAKAIQLQISQ